MAGVFLGQLLAFKYMPQMTTAIGAEYFRAAAIGISHMCNCAFNFIVKAGPATAGGEFISRAIERGITLLANEGACFCEVVVFTRKRPFGAFVKNDALLALYQAFGTQ